MTDAIVSACWGPYGAALEVASAAQAAVLAGSHKHFIADDGAYVVPMHWTDEEAARRLRVGKLAGAPRTASEIAKHAARLVSGDRAATHGDKRDTFGRVARFWNAYLQCRFGIAAPTLTPSDTAHLLSLLKKARMMGGAYNLDDYIDDVGYAAIAGELADGEQRVAGTVRAQAAAWDEPERDPTESSIWPWVFDGPTDSLRSAIEAQRQKPGDVVEVSKEEMDRIMRMTPHERTADAIQRRMDAEGDVEP